MNLGSQLPAFFTLESGLLAVPVSESLPLFRSVEGGFFLVPLAVVSLSSIRPNLWRFSLILLFTIRASGT